MLLIESLINARQLKDPLAQELLALPVRLMAAMRTLRVLIFRKTSQSLRANFMPRGSQIAPSNPSTRETQSSILKNR